MTRLFLIAITFLSLGFITNTGAQELTQTIRGTVVDKVSNTPLEGVVIIVLDSNPIKGTASDQEGSWRIEGVPLGRQTIKVTYMGYKELVVPNVVVNSGKEVILNLMMEEDIALLSQVEITARKNKNEAINSMNTVSTRTFSVEETQKFAAAVNDPGRMAASFAGVVSSDDGGNHIVIRGNSPTSLLWRMEGTDIPNPNHFAQAGSSGGGISILSAQLLDNSDFMTGAFSAEYGNALGGVFDLKLRKGNNERHEYTLQAGFLGFDAAAEGPLSKNHKGSYLFNYRYSTLSVLQNFGVNVGDAVTNFQDLSYNIHMPTEKAGTFSLFGFIGLSDQSLDADRDTTSWEDDEIVEDLTYWSNTGSIGLKHQIPLSDNTYVVSAITASGHTQGFKAMQLDYSMLGTERYKEDFSNGRFMLTTVLNNKFNSRHSLRSGIYVSQYYFDLQHSYTDDDTGEKVVPMAFDGNTQLVQAFSQWKYRMSEKMTLNAGFHSMYLTLNKSYSIEPRVAVKYDVDNSQFFTLGYGLHSQMQLMGNYFAQKTDEQGNLGRPNQNMDFNKAHHVVLGYQRNLNEHTYVKLEAYYQHLYNIAVVNDPDSPISSINNELGYMLDSMVNEGFGKNLGLELTMERFTYRGMYFLWSASVYDSKYKSLDGIWRNTRYNANFATSFSAGKEWAVGNPDKHKTLGLNLRLIYNGGFRTTPINLDASIAADQTEYYLDRAYEEKLPDYFRSDIKFSLKRNRKNRTTTFALDIQNCTNNLNVYGRYFDTDEGRVTEYTSVPLIPILSYKVEF
jgi:hypothetical protein